MIFLKIRLVDKFIFLNADKIVSFEENAAGFTRLFLVDGKKIDVPISTDDFFSQLTGSPQKNDDLILKPEDLELIFSHG